MLIPTDPSITSNSTRAQYCPRALPFPLRAGAGISKLKPHGEAAVRSVSGSGPRIAAPVQCDGGALHASRPKTAARGPGTFRLTMPFAASYRPSFLAEMKRAMRAYDLS